MMDYISEDRRRQLYHQIREWNQSRLDLFAISEPNQNLEFFGVMRFYYQDDDQRVSTKCIRVASSATTIDVIHNLIEKFRPDLRMLSRSQYGLYEVHASGEERRLGDRECPLLVQLHWGKDDIEGRFLLKKETARTATEMNDFGRENSARILSTSGVARRLSSKEKKRRSNQNFGKENDAERLYNELPDSNFTRSISNPEIVMQKRRQAKLQRKLNEIHSSEMGPDAGGTLKIYGQSICPEVPYKTLLLSVTDDAFNVVKETLEKYKLERENPNDYCLVKVTSLNRNFSDNEVEETVLNDFDCPLDILQDNPHLAGTGCITFHLRRRDDVHLLKSNLPLNDGQARRAIASTDMLPYLVEVNPDGTKPHDAHSFTIPLNGLEIGRDRSLISDGTLHLQLTGHDILPHHCIIGCHGNVVSVAPLSPDALVAVNNCRVYDRAVLEHGCMLLLGRTHFFRFHDPPLEQRSVPMVNVSSAAPNALNETPDLLPAVLEYRDEAEDIFLSAVITELNTSDVQFKLLPTYLVYMAARHVFNSRLHSSVNSGFRGSRLTLLLNKVVGIIYKLIQKSEAYAGTLAFWMANSSELLNFLCQDRGLRQQTLEAQEHLADCVQTAFYSLVHCLQEALNESMPSFFEPGPEAPEDVINVLRSIMSLLLTTNVNAALTIQLFSQMFHFINMWLFNQLVRTRQLCSREWGRRLHSRLKHIEIWSEKQGLELAAECHLARIIQSAHLLELPKRNADDVTVLCSSCFRLNSLQLRKLLENYVPAADEPNISVDFIERVVGIAQNTADETARNEGQEIRLLEDPELHLPFLMPDDGYSCEFIKGVLKDIVEYVEPLAEAGICRLIVNRSPQNPSGLWTVYFSSGEDPDNAGSFFQVAEPNRRSLPPAAAASSALPPVLDIAMVSFQKLNNSIGLSIVAAMGEGQNVRRIFIKSVVPGGAAAVDGRLRAGDELLEVDGQSLIGMTQEDAASVMSQTGQFVTLKVAKQSAVYYGLATQLGQHSPAIAQNAPSPMAPGGLVPRASSSLPPGMALPHSARVDTRDRDGRLTGQKGFAYPLTQTIHSGSQQAGLASHSSTRTYALDPLHQSQPSLRHPDYGQPSAKSFGQPFPSNGDVHKAASSSAFPTGGRYPRATHASTDGQIAPTRSKSVPDFDQMDFGGDSKVRQSGGTLPRGFQSGDLLYQHGRPGDDLKQPVLYPSTREVYSKGNYPPMRPLQVEKGPRPSSASGVSFAESGPKRQFGRTGRQTGSAAVPQKQSWMPAPSNLTNVYVPSGNLPKSQPLNGQQQMFQGEGPERDRRMVNTKGPSLTRYPNISGLNTIGLNDQQEPSIIHPQNQAGHVSGYPYASKPDLVYPASVSHGSRGTSARQRPTYYPNQRMEWMEENAPPVPPLPASIYASVSKGTMNQNKSYVGAGPTSVGTGYRDSRWNSSQPSVDPVLQQLLDQKEPEYAKVQPRNGANDSHNLASRSAMVSPWAREEKELEAKRREEEKRRLRAEEIFKLEQHPNLTKDEADKLQRLKLDAEFDRRLEEVSNQEDQDDDTEITPAGRAKLFRHYQQEYEMQRQQREEVHRQREKELLKEQEARRQWQEQRLQASERQRSEEKLLEIKRQEQQMKQAQDYFRKQQQLDEMHNPQRVSGPPQRPAEPVEETYSFPRKSPQILPPPPPERNSSFEVYRTGNAFIPTSADISLYGTGGHSTPAAKKSVSFQTTNQLHSSPGSQSNSQPPSGSAAYSAKPSANYARQTSTANVSSNSFYPPVEPATPFTPGTNEVFITERGTPKSDYQRQNSIPPTYGVVGAQERYLDPRERIAAAKLANVLTTGSYMTPDRMSFRDKMKHFASEAGEETPKDRSKISRAQQRLETDLSIQ